MDTKKEGTERKIDCIADLFIEKIDAVKVLEESVKKVVNDALACAVIEREYLTHDMIVYAKKVFGCYIVKSKKWDCLKLKDVL